MWDDRTLRGRAAIRKRNGLQKRERTENQIPRDALTPAHLKYQTVKSECADAEQAFSANMKKVTLSKSIFTLSLWGIV